MVIVEVGSINMDLVVKVPSIPKPGETVSGGVFNKYAGGKGANQAVTAARLGARVHMVGCVGKDAHGVELRSLLDQEGVDTRHVLVTPDQATGVALIQVDAHGQNSISVANGANFCLTCDHVEKALLAIGKFDALVMPLEIPIECVQTATRIAKEKGATLILNPAPAQVLEQGLLKLVDVLVPNEHEIEQLIATECKEGPQLRQAASVLLSQGLKNLLVTLGSRGSILFSAKTPEGLHISAFPTQTVDTTAAGDCFIGALAVSLCEGNSMTAATKFASAAAAISVSRSGAQPSLPDRDEVEKFLQEKQAPE